jgi:hypothetical protein
MLAGQFLSACRIQALRIAQLPCGLEDPTLRVPHTQRDTEKDRHSRQNSRKNTVDDTDEISRQAGYKSYNSTSRHLRQFTTPHNATTEENERARGKQYLKKDRHQQT